MQSLVWFGQVQYPHTKKVGDTFLNDGDESAAVSWTETKVKQKSICLTSSHINDWHHSVAQIHTENLATGLKCEKEELKEGSTQPRDHSLKTKQRKEKKQKQQQKKKHHCIISKFKLWVISHKVTVLNEFCVLDLCWRFSLHVFFHTSLLKKFYLTIFSKRSVCLCFNKCCDITNRHELNHLLDQSTQWYCSAKEKQKALFFFLTRLIQFSNNTTTDELSAE